MTYEAYAVSKTSTRPQVDSALDKAKAALACRMHSSGEPASTIATTLGVSRATVYRVLAEQAEDSK